jgi:drug/metabolite transporter (DMT)-like permease
MAGTLGVCVNFISYFLIQRTSSLTLKVVTTIRNVGVVFIGIIFFHETVTGQQVLIIMTVGSD